MRVRAALLVLLIVGFGLLLTQCPANRDGMPGQLAHAMKQSVTAARSGAFALDSYEKGRATAQLTSVQLSDARNDAVKAYKGVAELRAEDPVDVDRRRLLVRATTTIVDQLNAAAATVDGVTTQPSPESARRALLASAEALENGYR
jgi:hypothetical protein